jgi:2-keto-3-deoxy-L-rhamnonate aldolase RhmA
MKTKNPTIAEITGIAGFDFFILDPEHDPVGVETWLSLLR